MKYLKNFLKLAGIIAIPVLSNAQTPILLKPSDGLPGTQSIIRLPQTDHEVLENYTEGLFNPINPVTVNGRNTRGNDVLKTSSADEILAPGEKMYFYVNTQDKTLEYHAPNYTIDPICYTAINRAPKWIRQDLLYQFRRLHKYLKDDNYAQIILDAPENLVDEVAWSVAKISYKVLNDSRTYSNMNTLIRNAQLIYDIADSLKFVKLVEYGNFASGDYYTTTKYRIRNGASGTYSWVEVPKDIYYKYVVNPKIDQEGLYTTDNTGSAEQRSYGYFWREYLWFNPSKTYDYTKLNITTAYGSIDTIQRFGALIQEPDHLWDRVETYYLFNRTFKPTDHAMDKLGHWASRAIPLTANLPRAFQPNQTAYEHNGNCLEDAILCAAACRTALIPIVYLNAIGEDHAYGSFWDQGWHHFEFFRGGFDPNINAQYRGMTNLVGDGSYGWTTSFVRGVESDGSGSNHTKEYTVKNGQATIEISVADANGNPVDGAKVVLWSKGSSWVSNIGFLSTSHTGIVREKVGAGKEYAYQVYHPAFGWMPSSTQAYYLTPQNVKAVKDNEYKVSANLTGTMPSIALSNKLEVPATSNYGVHLTFETREIITGTYADINQSEFGVFDSIGITSVFICNDSNFQKYNSGQAFDAYQVNLRIVAGNMQIPLPAEGKWYVILSNELLKANYQSVKATCELTSNASYSGISNEMQPSVSVFPNPVTRNLIISNPAGVKDIRIVDMFGRIVYILPNNATIWTPDESLSDGIYYLLYSDSGRTFTEKLVLNRNF
jgi:hypothetical protein